MRNSRSTFIGAPKAPPRRASLALCPSFGVWDKIGHDHLAIWRGGKGRLRWIGKGDPMISECCQDARVDLMLAIHRLTRIIAGYFINQQKIEA